MMKRNITPVHGLSPSAICRVCLVFCCWIAVFSAVAPAHAFYHSDVKETESLFLSGHGKIPWKQGEKVFAVYDNLKHRPADLHLSPVIFPRSGDFVPADLIPCDLPLYTVLRPSEIKGDPIANLLYANLELRKLFQEYNALHKRVQKMLAGITPKGSDFSPGFLDMLTGNRVESAIIRENASEFSAPLPADKPSVYKEWMRLNQKAGIIAREAASLEISEKNIPIAGIGSLMVLRSLSNPEQVISQEITAYFGDKGFLQGQASSSGKAKSSSTRSDAFRDRSGGRFYEGSGSIEDGGFLLWVLRLPSKIVRYVTSNKIKSLAASVVLFLIGYGVLAILRSRKY